MNLETHKLQGSQLPLLLYRKAFFKREEEGAQYLEDHFKSNHWSHSWRDSIYDFHHFHTTAHEVLGVYQGSATLKLGGDLGEIIDVTAGDIIVIPAGVSHKSLEHSPDFRVVGAYAEGRDWDVVQGEAITAIEDVPVPEKDPFTGRTIWH